MLLALRKRCSLAAGRTQIEMCTKLLYSTCCECPSLKILFPPLLPPLSKSGLPQPTCSNASSRGGGWLRSSAAPGKADAVRRATAAFVQIIISATTSIIGTLGLAFTATGWPFSSVCAQHQEERVPNDEKCGHFCVVLFVAAVNFELGVHSHLMGCIPACMQLLREIFGACISTCTLIPQKGR